MISPMVIMAGCCCWRKNFADHHLASLDAIHARLPPNQDANRLAPTISSTPMPS